GDSNYPKFCAFGKIVDERLERLGAVRAHPRVDFDVEFEKPFQMWLSAALGALTSETVISQSVTSDLPASPDISAPVLLITDSPITDYSRSRPFPAPLVANRPLNGPGSAKDTRHLAFSLAGSGLTYEAGDVLGVAPMNCAD